MATEGGGGGGGVGSDPDADDGTWAEALPPGGFDYVAAPVVTEGPLADRPEAPELVDAMFQRPAFHEASAMERRFHLRDALDVAGRVVGWTLVAFMGLAAGTRVVAFDDFGWATVLSAYTFFLFLPAYVVGVVAGIFARWWLAGACLVLVVCHLVWVLPTVPAGGTLPFQPERESPRLTVWFANVNAENPDPQPILAEILEVAPEVAVLVEYTPEWAAAVAGSGAFAEYPHRVEEPRRDETGIAVLSRRPLGDVQVVGIDGRPVVRADVQLGAGSGVARIPRAVRLYAVHPASPRADHDGHVRQLERLRRALDADLVADRDLLVVGTFHATQFNESLQSLEGVGLDSAHERRGRGLARTWPNGSGILGAPRLRLDHALVSDRILVFGVGEGAAEGSDHRSVRVEIAFDALETFTSSE